MAKDHPLIALLKLERAVILAGDFGALNDMAPRKEKLMQSLEAGDVEAPVLSRITHAVEHNQTLLQAAMDGIGHVIKRLDDVRRGRESFDSYDPQGGKSTVGGTKSAFERKA